MRTTGSAPKAAGEAHRQRRRGGAVDIVVADEPNRSPAASARRGGPRHGRGREVGGVGQPVPQPRARGRPATPRGPGRGRPTPGRELAEPRRWLIARAASARRRVQPPGAPRDAALDLMPAAVRGDQRPKWGTKRRLPRQVVLGLDDPDRAGLRAHHDRMGEDPPPKRRTPLSKAPSVTPVAANITSPWARSSRS